METAIVEEKQETAVVKEAAPDVFKKTLEGWNSMVNDINYELYQVENVLSLLELCGNNDIDEMKPHLYDTHIRLALDVLKKAIKKAEELDGSIFGVEMDYPWDEVEKEMFRAKRALERIKVEGRLIPHRGLEFYQGLAPLFEIAMEKSDFSFSDWPECFDNFTSLRVLKTKDDLKKGGTPNDSH